MRVERNYNQHPSNCWLTTDEYEQLRRTTDSYRDDLIVRLGGEVGLCSFEVPQITPDHFHREIIDDDDSVNESETP